METLTIRAKTPKDYNAKIHRVTKFKRYNCEFCYALNDDGYYRSDNIYADSTTYSETALLGLSDFEVVSFRKQ